MTLPSPGFGDLLRAARHRRGLSQLELAGRANLSTRHLSFIECGRAQPGVATMRRLLEALGVDERDAGALLDAAGFAPPVAPRATAADLFAPPPMALLTPAGHLLACNDALQRALALIGDLDARWTRTCGEGGRNLLLLTFHPEGLAPFMENHDEIARLTLAPLVQRAPACRASAETLARLRRFPRVRAVLDAGVPGMASPPAVPERYRFGARRLRFTSLYVPLDEERLQAMFVPADARTRRIIDAAASRR